MDRRRAFSSVALMGMIAAMVAPITRPLQRIGRAIRIRRGNKYVTGTTSIFGMVAVAPRTKGISILPLGKGLTHEQLDRLHIAKSKDGNRVGRRRRNQIMALAAIAGSNS